MLKPTVGPIIGHTTTNHARILVRGQAQNSAPVFAGIRYRQSGHEQWLNSVFARLTYLQDMSDVIVLNNLAADTEYEYQACLLYTSPSPRDRQKSRMPSSA